MFGFQAGWKENHATFMSELKNLQASGLTTLGQALRSSFDLLNLNRLISGIDNYGQVKKILSEYTANLFWLLGVRILNWAWLPSSLLLFITSKRWSI